MAKVNSKLESIIEQMEQLIEQSKPVFLSSTNISVDREKIEDLVRQFRNNLPEEIERYRKLVSNKEAIERSAQEEADRFMANVRQQADDLLSQSEITKNANKQADDMVAAAAEEADRILTQARYEADEYLASAQSYLNDMLMNLSGIIYDCVESTTRNTNKFLDSLNVVGQTVQDNLNELNAVPEAPAPVQAQEMPGMFDGNADVGGGVIQ